MDFIERLFGISPDNGDGSTELMLFATFVIIVAGLAGRPVTRWYEAKRRRL
jgi:hypothetical protein